jgi:hypothetical protein
MMVEELLETCTVSDTVHLDGPLAIIPPTYFAPDHEDALRYILSMINLYGPDTKIVYSWHSEGFLVEVIQLMNTLGEILITEHNVPIENFVYISAAAPVKDNVEYYKTYKNLFPYIPNRVYFEKTWEGSASVFLPNEPRAPDHSLDPNREKNFIFLNGGARSHRVVALTELYNRGLLDKSYLSFYDRSIHEGPIYDIFPNLADSVIETHTNFLRDMLPIKLTLTEDKHNMYHLTADDIELHQNSLFSLISETLFCSNIDTMLESEHYFANAQCFPCILLSEKTCRTIKQQHPFIILGHVNTLKGLREMGYKTFSPYINESYDEIQNDEERLIAVINEVERLSNMSIDETKDWLEGVHQITKYNFKHLTQQELTITKVDISL